VRSGHLFSVRKTKHPLYEVNDLLVCLNVLARHRLHLVQENRNQES